jgi:hypothetical protein
MSRPAHPFSCSTGSRVFSQVLKRWDVKLSTQIHLLPMLRMSRAITLVRPVRLHILYGDKDTFKILLLPSTEYESERLAITQERSLRTTESVIIIKYTKRVSRTLRPLLKSHLLRVICFCSLPCPEHLDPVDNIMAT